MLSCYHELKLLAFSSVFVFYFTLPSSMDSSQFGAGILEITHINVMSQVLNLNLPQCLHWTHKQMGLSDKLHFESAAFPCAAEADAST